MSKKIKRKPSEAREPWEQSIYDTDKDLSNSRSEKRLQKKGNTAFLTILVIMLLLIIAIPIATIMYLSRDNTNKTTTQTSASSVVQSSTEDTNSTTDSSSADPQEDSSATDTSASVNQADDTDAIYTVVQSGEGPNQVATRNGITVDELLELNDLTLDDVLQPGQSLRVQ